MKQYSFTNDDLRLAAASVRMAMISTVQETGDDHEFSTDFLGRIDKLLVLDELRIKRKLIRRRVAGLFLAFAIGASIFFATNVEARATFLSWVREVYESSVVYRYFGSPQYVLPEYELSWIPEGFTLEQRFEQEQDGNICRDMIYVNSKTGDGFIFTYQTMTDDIPTILSAYEGEALSEPEKCFINNAEGVYYPPEQEGNSSDLLWFDNERGIAFAINSSLDKPVILHIAERVVLAHPTN